MSILLSFTIPMLYYFFSSGLMQDTDDFFKLIHVFALSLILACFWSIR